ncbi:MAG: 16S rRNA (cytidine(1402)-2'-O)-methyltransferase, partial [Clostridium perfringens]|nr:16S rRNA (cytidine(1402)-2'-O)-methyltransferase [Clostridium perfringens]
EDIKDRTETIIIYESPYRILDTIDTLKEGLGNRKVAICRELTKLHEEIFRGTLEEAKIHFEENAPKGEFVCVISGKTDKEIEEENTSKWISMSIEEHIIHYIDNEGMKKKDAIKQVAKDRGVAKSEIYKFSLDI